MFTPPPRPTSFNHVIYQKAKAALEDAGHDVRVRDLYSLNFKVTLDDEDLTDLENGTISEDVRNEQEHIACFDSDTGKLVWEKKFNVWHSTIPFNRLGWASLGADSETGNIYAHLVSGLLLCFDTDGNIQWVRSMTEEFNRFSGYGGRLHTPVIDGDLVIISMGNLGWAAKPPSHRYMGINKHTGETVWMSRPGGGNQVDLTVYSTPVTTTIDGQRAFIAGNGNGGIFAVKVATGEKIWGFAFSNRGINTSPAVANNRVYATHSEENVGNTSLGSVVCLDATTGKFSLHCTIIIYNIVYDRL